MNLQFKGREEWHFEEEEAAGKGLDPLPVVSMGANISKHGHVFITHAWQCGRPAASGMHTAGTVNAHEGPAVTHPITLVFRELQLPPLARPCTVLEEQGLARDGSTRKQLPVQPMAEEWASEGDMLPRC